MNNVGVVLELSEEQAIILTNNAEFKKIKREPGMFVGQQVAYGTPRRKWFVAAQFRYSLGLAAIVLSFLMFTAYHRQSEIYAYVAMDINPSVEFAINQRIRVISVKSLNHEGAVLLRGTRFKNIPLDNALLMVIAKAENNHYLRGGEGKVILVSFATREALRVKPGIVNSLTNLTQRLTKRHIQLQYVETTFEQRKMALKNGLSMGRYVLLHRANDAGRSITVKQAKTSSIYKLLNDAGVIDTDANQSNQSSTLSNGRQTDQERNNPDIQKNKDQGVKQNKPENNKTNDSNFNGGLVDNDQQPETSVPGDDVLGNDMNGSSSGSDIAGTENTGEKAVGSDVNNDTGSNSNPGQDNVKSKKGNSSSGQTNSGSSAGSSSGSSHGNSGSVSSGSKVLALAETSDMVPALSRIQAEISAQGALSEKEAGRLMSRIRTEFQRMARAGVPREKVDEAANQACRMVREMAQNAGDLKKLHLAISLMVKETIKGKNPAEVGEKIRQNLQKCNNLNQALSQTKEQIREQDRMEQKAQNQSNQGSSESNQSSGNGGGSGSGSGGSSSGSGGGSGGSGGGGRG